MSLREACHALTSPISGLSLASPSGTASFIHRDSLSRITGARFELLANGLRPHLGGSRQHDAGGPDSARDKAGGSATG